MRVVLLTAIAGVVTGCAQSPGVGTATPATTAIASEHLVDDAVAAELRKVTGASPVLVPAAGVSGYRGQASATSTTYTLSLTSADSTKTVRLAIAEPNPSPPSDHTRQSNPNFHGDARSVYQVDDDTQPGSVRTLLWIQPGTWTVEARGGVPYALTSEGLTDSEFWTVANSLRSLSTSG